MVLKNGDEGIGRMPRPKGNVKYRTERDNISGFEDGGRSHDPRIGGGL